MHAVMDRLDDLPKPALVALVVIGFIVFWPIGLALLVTSARTKGPPTRRHRRALHRRRADQPVATLDVDGNDLRSRCGAERKLEAAAGGGTTRIGSFELASGQHFVQQMQSALGVRRIDASGVRSRGHLGAQPVAHRSGHRHGGQVARHDIRQRRRRQLSGGNR